jgi:hypothetical protein
MTSQKENMKTRTTVEVTKNQPTFPVREMDASKGWKYHWLPSTPTGGVELVIANPEISAAVENKIKSAAETAVMQLLNDLADELGTTASALSDRLKRRHNACLLGSEKPSRTARPVWRITETGETRNGLGNRVGVDNSWTSCAGQSPQI